MEGRTCGGRRQKTVMIEIRAFIRNVKERARMTRVEELAKNCIDWVWGCMGKEMQKKNMWSNQQKTVMIGAGDVWGRKYKEGYAEKSTNTCNGWERCIERGGDRRNEAWWTSTKN